MYQQEKSRRKNCGGIFCYAFFTALMMSRSFGEAP